ncbi:helix-turn-helix domain-containing protein [Bradyrhizobium manausense]|uniref:Helix-turn-helix domain-containing protein n=1 Tax=Bradyrhizobium manausense TaxID=989370 RepID=A0A0R3E754_9BRAD|nr:hypothetical protein AOQ71_10200 [Bradyrhizobium manausense]
MDVELLTIKEAAHILRISVPSLRRLQSDRHIPFIKIGGCVRFDKKDIIDYLNKRRYPAMH